MTLAELAQLVFTAIVAIGGSSSLVLVLRYRADRRKVLADAGKTDAEAAAVLSGAAITLLEPLQAEVSRLTTRVHELEARVATLTADLDAAHAQLARRPHR